MGARICVIDYEKGNLASVERGLADAGFDAFISNKPADILGAQGLVLPGVGSFADAMTTMNELGQTQAIKERVAQGRRSWASAWACSCAWSAATRAAPKGRRWRAWAW